ncbi:MAPEG family protein [Aurantiacibacter aquimixticola]|uniref:MAPEG family protein n=1 Tax=Aurantiacibacter aquimixticola TaxID=1958945 RepID=A0A419RWG9_9SPHN|nr:MAPEG family protein [Aurantiacibacter aquimixticola]RJY10128.1 MAPEG family protein [Aurantiacibacter aquimixticola]
MADLHISLLSIALAASLNLWLAIRCSKVRISDKVLHGDGGNAALAKRMRAHANFIEYTPIGLLLILVIDLGHHHGWALAAIALAFLGGRVLHAFGMEADKPNKLRMIGTLTTWICYAILIGWAVLVALGVA